MKYFHPLIYTLFLFIGCYGDKAQPEPPDPLLNKDQMVDLMTEMYLIEAIIEDKKLKYEDSRALGKRYYDLLYQEMGLSKEIVLANLGYYNKQSDEMIEIMDRVLVELGKRKSIIEMEVERVDTISEP